MGHVSALCPTRQHLVVHGHEPSPRGYIVEHDKLFNLSSSFAMRRADKSFLRLSLSDTYLNAYEVEACIKPLFEEPDDSGLGELPIFLDDDTLDESEP